jgi:2-C-methyl-D-erythritol 4-phosphate cytidylyltransferase
LIDEIAVAVSPEYFQTMEKIIAKYSFKKKIIIAEGGKERQDSVFSAISVLNPNPEDFICVHDAARPFLSNEILKNALQAAEENGSAVVAIKSRDTLLNAKENVVTDYVNRDNVYYVQTPQIFKYSLFSGAIQKAKEDNFVGTDESMLLFRAGEKVLIVDGDISNFKITTKNDLEIAEKLLK